MVKNGTAGAAMQKVLGALKAEAVYFTEQDGTRGAVLVIDVKEPSAVPSFAEPFFLNFNADCRSGTLNGVPPQNAEVVLERARLLNLPARIVAKTGGSAIMIKGEPPLADRVLGDAPVPE